MFLKLKKSIVIFSFITSSFPMMNANAGENRPWYCANGRDFTASDKMFRSSSTIIEENRRTMENMMNYYNIRQYYPNITRSIANEIKEDMYKYLPTDRLTSECPLYSLVDLVLDSNGNIKNASYSTLRSILGG